MLTQLSSAAALSLADGGDSTVQLPSQLLFADAAGGGAAGFTAPGSLQLQLQSSQMTGGGLQPHSSPRLRSSQRSLRSALGAAPCQPFLCGTQRTAISLPPQSLPFPAMKTTHRIAGQPLHWLRCRCRKFHPHPVRQLMVPDGRRWLRSLPSPRPPAPLLRLRHPLTSLRRLLHSQPRRDHPRAPISPSRQRLYPLPPPFHPAFSEPQTRARIGDII